MKWIKYKICIAEGMILDKEMGFSEENEQIAKREAYNGEYTIVDDGQPELVYEPTTDEVLNALLGVTE